MPFQPLSALICPFASSQRYVDFPLNFLPFSYNVFSRMYFLQQFFDFPLFFSYTVFFLQQVFISPFCFFLCCSFSLIFFYSKFSFPLFAFSYIVFFFFKRFFISYSSHTSSITHTLISSHTKPCLSSLSQCSFYPFMLPRPIMFALFVYKFFSNCLTFSLIYLVMNAFSSGFFFCFFFLFVF